MHTARALTVSPSMLCVGGMSAPGGGCLVWGVSAPREGGIPACTEADPPGGAWSRGCLLPGGGSAPVWGVPGLGGVCSQGGVCSHVGVPDLGGVCSQGGLLPACTEADPPCEQNHTRL